MVNSSCLCSSLYFATAFLYARAFVCSPVYSAWIEWLGKKSDSVYEKNVKYHLALPEVDQEFFISRMRVLPWCETRTFSYLKVLLGFYTHWAFLWDTSAKNSACEWQTAGELPSYLRHRVSFGVFPCFLGIFRRRQTNLWNEKLRRVLVECVEIDSRTHHLCSRFTLLSEIIIVPGSAEPITEQGFRR